ncbi:hypothetical protein VOLCADRAFT_93844 [Volvox carteri f. nagariensis]|uniref:Sucrose phosphatase-like domain-containing protein n=1 Tax=Volvox carteri f. nagariensis TaxID=3068 RepID=D8U377_VOLCA|nr:uncharacterized protein VOLCADRAFT_93844 [Volvox carteri f. nagariensis]EFJ45705.1 hypothetical protein VOLCADRAFT_93844 [Volvox carteri f. nagariensis]|eukprot:XP_002953106.1 hypothetical protein VOLCADRAFT_93844 [Volvox carteri f. nagariensis]
MELVLHETVYLAVALDGNDETATGHPGPAGATAEALRSSDVTTSSVTPSLKLFYRTGWDRAVVHGSLCGSPWRDFPLSKAAEGPERWLVAEVPLDGPPGPPPAGKPLLEFVVADTAKTNWDKPAAGGNYCIDVPGVYSLRGGNLRKVGGRPVLVVSDLDGTMVGDDSATAAFKSWWEDAGVLRGGVLVYNTGRSLDSFLELLRSKSSVMATPDALILAVGTCVYLRNPAGGPPDQPSGWKEDRDWSATLDERWNLKRYMDVVPIRAGKLEALNHVRRHFGFSTASTVACGDSGNDILMLSGENLAIVVGNAQPDLRQWAQQRQATETPLPSGKQRMMMAARKEALGILEGLEYFGFKC